MDKTNDLTYKVANTKVKKGAAIDIDYKNSKHVKSLQKSNYICIDHDLMD
jgi:hypothetical protein